MSDLVTEPVQQPPDVKNIGSASSLEGVSDGVGSCLDSTQSSTAVQSPLSTRSPDVECAQSEADALKSQEGVSITNNPVSKGATNWVYLISVCK